MINKEISSLIKISRSIGLNKGYIQGGGGNTSVKAEGSQMAIKSSGSLLAEMSATNGFCYVDFRDVNQYLKKRSINEKEFSTQLSSFAEGPDSKPSIETGFHSLLGKYVLHTHSVYVNFLLCSKEGRGILQKLQPNAIWVDYFSPGMEITFALKRELSALEVDINTDQIIFLQNHGVIISSPSLEGTIKYHELINEKIRKEFKLKEFVINSTNPPTQEKILFPDQVVYSLSGEKLLKTQAARETLAAYNYISTNIRQKGFTPNFLNSSDIDYIQAMESEKFRQSITK